jgi:hypothetical protein
MAAKNKPAGIRSLVYGIVKGKVRIEGLSVSAPLPGTKPAPSRFIPIST